MKVKEIIWEHKHNFSAIFECEYCLETKTGRGYDATFFHEDVIPNLICEKCWKSASHTYRPKTTEYPDDPIYERFK